MVVSRLNSIAAIGREAAGSGTCVDSHDIAAGHQSLDETEVPTPRRVAVQANIDAPHLTPVLYRLEDPTPRRGRVLQHLV